MGNVIIAVLKPTNPFRVQLPCRYKATTTLILITKSSKTPALILQSGKWTELEMGLTLEL